MAKVERQFSRATAALAEDEYDDIFRPHAVDRPRPLPPYEEAGEARSASDEDEEAVPLRRRRTPVRRSRLPKGRLGRILLIGGLVAAVTAVVLAVMAVHSFFMTDARFRIDSSASIQVLGNSQVTRSELLSVFGSDIGRNIFYVPLKARQQELEQLPWVAHATVMRLLPNQLRVAVVERVPVAFVRQGNRIGLMDASGVLLDMPPAMMAAKHYSFPVVTGVTPQQAGDQRAARMRLYQQFVGAVGPAATSQISEVDLSDPEDVRVLLPSAGTDLLVHFGSEDFAGRWQMLQQKLPAWREKYPRLAGVDLRYQRQTVLELAKEPDDSGATAAAPPVKAPAAPVKAATRTHATARHSAAVQHKTAQHKATHHASAHGERR